MSKKFSLNKADLISLGKGLAITAGGAALTYLTAYFTSTDFGAWTPIVVTLSALVINAIRKFIEGK
jgi:hypothetical protein